MDDRTEALWLELYELYDGDRDGMLFGALALVLSLREQLDNRKEKE